MRKVKGNTPFVIQIQDGSVLNEIGERVTTWKDAVSFDGILSLQSGDSKYTNYKTKAEESSHVVLTDFNADIYALADRNTRLLTKGRMYDVLLIDNPDELNEHLELYLRFVGVQNG